MSRDKETYGKISRQYDEWAEMQANRPAPEPVYHHQGPYIPEPRPRSDMGKLVFAAIGMGIGAALLALSAFTFYVSAQWDGYARSGAAVGYFVVAFFLLLAGLGGIAATWNHNFRVLNRPPQHH